MNKPLAEQITESRRLLQNQYAYLNAVGDYSAVPVDEAVRNPSSDRIAASRLLLQDPYAYLNEHGDFSSASDRLQLQPPTRPETPQNAKANCSSLLRNKRTNSTHSTVNIEKSAIDLQRQIWRERHVIWPDTVPSNPIAMLDPAIALRLIGYDFIIDETLGHHFINGRQIEVAGTIDDSSRQVHISRRFPHEVQNFTAAHELGHACLHDARGLHRDKPLNGATKSRERIEFEADKFASCFLMPEKLVRAVFRSLFTTENFFLDEETTFALSRGSSLVLNNHHMGLRDLCRLLASTQSFNGLRFLSLASQFHVSSEAMAIRLEELDLVAL